MYEPDYRRLLIRTLIALAACSAVVVICYYWVDRPIAFYVHDHLVNKIEFFKWLTLPPPVVQTWSPLIIVLLMVRRAWGSWTRCELVLFTAILSLIIADEFRTSLGDLFGRYWPETWRNDNPSLIGNGTYGFHPFQSGDDVGSFPSGHAARIVGLASVLWVAMPRSRWLLVVVCLPMIASLVAMNYHFVSDVIAGSVLGAIVGTYAVTLANLRQPVANLAPRQL